MDPAEHIFLSPHYDDAALSCGGLIAQLCTAGKRAVVATLFGGKPDYSTLSPLARMIHGRPLAGADLVEQRQAEERRALALLGAESRLGAYLDCIYRQDAHGARWLYASEQAIFGAVDPADHGLAEELANYLAGLAPDPNRCQLYAPLAVGHHVDHQIVQRSAALLQSSGYAVFYYEDYPYVVRDPDGLAATTAGREPRSQWQAYIAPLSPADLQRKIDAVLAYTTQLGVLFPGEGDPRPRVTAALAAYAQQAGQGQLAERLWSRPGWP